MTETKTAGQRIKAKERYRELIVPLVKRRFPGEVLLVLHGSLARGDRVRSSDIDLAIYKGRPLSAREWLQFTRDLEELPILREIDLIDLAEVEDLALLKKILETGEVWIESRDLLESLKERLESSGNW